MRSPLLATETRNSVDTGRHNHVPSHIDATTSLRGLDEACLTADRLRLDRFPATASRKFLTPEGYALLLAN
jgi:hypothetical protein